MAREDAQLKLRLADQLKAAITEAAAANKRSINAEIVDRLERSFTVGTFQTPMSGFMTLPTDVSMDDLGEALERARKEATHRALKELGIVIRPFEADENK